MRKFHEGKLADAPEVSVWGTGEPRREFLHVDDLADACVFLMNHYEGDHALNIGVGEDVTIRALAELLRRVVGYRGNLCFDATKPDGTPRKLLDVTRLHALGWKARIPLELGVAQTYAWYARAAHAAV
jgi:GDP-L-fucose synthase